MTKELVLDRLQKLCSKSEYCQRDIRAKALRLAGEDSDEVSSIVQSLVDDGFVSDSRYAAAFAREKAYLTGWGRVKIRFELRGKGIPDDVIDSALDGIDAGKASDRLEKLLRTRLPKALEKDYPRYELIRFALSHGYEVSEAETITDGIMDGTLSRR